MDNTSQVELIELKSGYQHEMDILDAMLQENQDDNCDDGVALENITAARRKLVLQAINRFEAFAGSMALIRKHKDSEVKTLSFIDKKQRPVEDIYRPCLF